MLSIRQIIELKRSTKELSKLIKTFILKEGCQANDEDIYRWQNNLVNISNSLRKDKILKILFYLEIRQIESLHQKLRAKLSN